MLHDSMEPLSVFDNLEDIALAYHLNSVFDQVLIQHNVTESLERAKRDEKDSFTQTIFQVRQFKILIYLSSFLPFSLQYSAPKRKCRNAQSLAVASGANAVSYMSFVAAVITLVLNINNNINANNNNLNRVNLNYGSSKNTVTNLNQNVGNNFNLMFPPGKKKKKRRSIRIKSVDDLLMSLADLGNDVLAKHGTSK